jgi:hypothetical protein
MTIRSDSYSSTAEVTAFTRHLLRGAVSFNSTTRPTSTEVEKFIDRASGVLNAAIAERGFAPSAVIANSTAKLLCDDWVTTNAAKYVEMTQRGAGYGDQQGSRTAVFSNLYKSAQDFMDANKLGIQRLGVTQAYPLSAGLAFTALGDKADRQDPQDTTIEQPFFERGQFDFPQIDTGEDK